MLAKVKPVGLLGQASLKYFHQNSATLPTQNPRRAVNHTVQNSSLDHDRTTRHSASFAFLVPVRHPQQRRFLDFSSARIARPPAHERRPPRAANVPSAPSLLPRGRLSRAPQADLNQILCARVDDPRSGATQPSPPGGERLLHAEAEQTLLQRKGQRREGVPCAGGAQEQQCGHRPRRRD